MKCVIGVTMGDPSGIGAEIIVKALNNRSIYEKCVPVVLGDKEAMLDAVRFTNSSLGLNCIKDMGEAKGRYGVIDCINLGHLSPGSWEYKKVCRLSGEASFQYIIKAIEYAADGRIQAVVTAPINKEAIHAAGHHFAGHTEIFAYYTGTDKFGMMLTSPSLKVMHVTTHVSMRDACDIIRNHPERVESAILLAGEAMRLLGNDRPRIAVAGLNAHCSENGLFGDEEELSILPAIAACKEKGIDVDGPVPPDTVFVKAIGGQYDIVVAMYHDQGHIPLKITGFKLDGSTNTYTAVNGVNMTVGLPIIRTSVDHGTAFEIAGEGRANEDSMVDAIEMAVTMAGKKFGL